MSARSASSTGSRRPLIARLWHGAVPAAKGDDYAAYLRRTGVTECRATPGNRGVEVLRRTVRSEEHTSELQSRLHLVCRLLLEKKKTKNITMTNNHNSQNIQLARR